VTEKAIQTGVATDTAVVEIDELSSIISEGQERGFVAADALAAAMEEAELSAQQAQDILSQLEEHGVDVLDAGSAAGELQADIRPGATSGAAADDGDAPEAEEPRTTARNRSAPFTRGWTSSSGPTLTSRPTPASTRCACTCVPSDGCRC